MKTLLLLVPALFLLSCAGMNNDNNLRLLAASGFQPRKPQNAQQSEIYNQMEPYKLYHKEVRGKMIYAYKDPESGLVYIGGPEENQKYQEYALQQSIAQQQRVAAEMQMDAAMTWGAWGPYGPWWY